MNNNKLSRKLEKRDWMAIILFALVVFLMVFLQYTQYTDVGSKRIKNIIVILICSISIISSVTRHGFMLLDRFTASIFAFLIFILFSEIVNNRFSIEYYYYASVSFFALIGGYSLANSYCKRNVERIIKTSLIPIYIILSGMFLINFSKLGFSSAGVQTSIVYPLLIFVLIGCFYSDNITLICSIPMFYGGFLLMARSVILLTTGVVLIKLFRSQNNVKGFFKKIILFTGLFIVIVVLFRNVLNSSGANILIKTQLRGGDFSSGRNDIYINSLKYYFNFGLVHMLIGSGFNTASRLFGISGHSDFIQFLLNYGIIGMLWYTKIQFTCIKKTRRNGLNSIALIEIAVLVLYIMINQFFLAVGPSTIWGLTIGMFAGRECQSEGGQDK